MPQQLEQISQEQNRNINQEQEQTATAQQQGNQTGIPDNLKASIEYMSGISLADVRVEYNSDKTAGTVVVKANNTSVCNLRQVEQFKLQQGDELRQKRKLGTDAKTFILFEVLTSPADPSLVGREGMVEVNQLEDKGDGAATVDLPSSRCKNSYRK